jgi:hypothetical protein
MALASEPSGSQGEAVRLVCANGERRMPEAGKNQPDLSLPGASARWISSEQ